MSTAARSADVPGQTARTLLRQAWKATLSTLVVDSGHPYGSLVTVAAEADGTPLLLLSALAVHSKNIASDQRASLLVDATGSGRDALTGARVTLVGRLAPTQSQTARRRYLARHPDAARFIDFGDFDLYALDVSWAHLVAGFGRIERLAREAIILETAGAESMVSAEPDIVAHMNDDHADTLPLLAGAFGASKLQANKETGGNPQSWAMVGSVPEGFDLVGGNQAVRVLFPQRVKTPQEVRSALVDMVAEARRRGM